MKHLSAALILAIGGCVFKAQAGIVITGTRVIYPAAEREVTVQFINQGATPRLAQAWIDTGLAEETAETTHAPFLITPAMVRVEAGQGQALRVMFTGNALDASIPQDRESVYWLNLVDIPPRPNRADASDNFLQFAVRSRLKVFYRPKGLPGDPVSAMDALSWRLVRGATGYVLECTNPTAFNVSFSEVALKNQPPVNAGFGKGGMCPAKGTERFELVPEATDLVRANGELTYTAIDDYGAFLQRSARFVP